MKKSGPILALLACAVLFGGTFYILLRDRFESGDVYPPASSLRSDPLGTMIFYESLKELPGIRVERDHSAVNTLPDGARTTYLHLAARADDWETMSPDLYRLIDQFLLQGGRLVITLTPEYFDRELEKMKAEAKKKEDKKADKEKSAKKDKDKEKKPDEKTKKKSDEKIVSLKEKWGLEFSKTKPGDSEAKNVSPLPLAPELEWHGDIVLKKPDARWEVIYRTKIGPVVAEKKRGSGSIVVATDSFFVSNEAMVDDRQTELLAWLVGSSDTVVFDEAHFGIVNSPGLAALARKYRLHGGVLALAILAGLFIWKNSSSLAPPRRAARESDDVIPGRATGAGFVSLLKRTIPTERVLAVCLDEWKKTFGHGTRFTPKEKEAVETLVREDEARPARERNPVNTYQKIRAALRRQHS